MLLRYKCDRVNLVRGLTAPFIFLSPYVFGFYPGYEILTTLLLWSLLSDINHVLHLHVHCPFTTSKSLNRLLDIFMGFTSGMTASVWRIQHVYGHHKHYATTNKNRSKKSKWEPGAEWETKRYTILGALSYSAWTIVPVFYHALVESIKKGVFQNMKHPVDYRYAFFEQVLIIFSIAMLYLVAPTITLFYLLPWYFLVQFVSRYTDYLNHVGCGHGFYNASNNTLNHWYNKLGNNFGYHSAHHFNPSAHWSTLPDIHNKIREKIPAERIKTYSWSGYLMPYHFYLSKQGRM